jgi:hypothetical protein
VIFLVIIFHPSSLISHPTSPLALRERAFPDHYTQFLSVVNIVLYFLRTLQRNSLHGNGLRLGKLFAPLARNSVPDSGFVAVTLCAVRTWDFPAATWRRSKNSADFHERYELLQLRE